MGWATVMPALLFMLEQAEPAAADVVPIVGIHLAAKEGNAAEVRRLLEQDASRATYMTFGNISPLMWAAAEGHVEVTKLLLAHGADALAENDLGFSVSQLVKQSVDDEETKQVLLGMLSGVAEGEQTDAHVEQQASSDEGITQPRGRVQEEEMPHDENDPQLDPASVHLHESEDADPGDTFESSDQEDAFVNALIRFGISESGRDLLRLMNARDKLTVLSIMSQAALNNSTGSTESTRHTKDGRTEENSQDIVPEEKKKKTHPKDSSKTIEGIDEKSALVDELSAAGVSVAGVQKLLDMLGQLQTEHKEISAAELKTALKGGNQLNAQLKDLQLKLGDRLRVKNWLNAADEHEEL